MKKTLAILLLLLVGIAGCGLETPTAMTEFKKGVEFAAQGDYDTAIACYTKAIRINPNLAVAHFNRGMAYYKGEEYGDAGMAFDNFAKLFPDDTLTSDALFWAGESYRQGNHDSLAFRRYNQCRWDFPTSEVAKDARHRLTLPEMLQQYDAEANKVDQDDIPASKSKAARGSLLGGTPMGERDGSSELVVDTVTALKKLGADGLDGLAFKNTGEVLLVNLEGTKITDAGLVHLEPLTNLQELDLGSTEITDMGLVHLKGLTKLQTLDLGSTKITDAGLAHLKGLQLTSLVIPNDAKTDLGLKHFCEALETHTVLYLKGWNITDAGLVHLKGMTNLQELGLVQTKITDAGLVHLKGLTKLQSLGLRGTQVTDAGVADLQKALPNCEISH